MCDYCGCINKISYCDYNKSTKNGTEKYSCKKCITLKRKEYKNYQNVYYNRFLEFCKKNNYVPISSSEEYKNAMSKLKYICPFHGEQEITYASISVGGKCKFCGYETAKNKLKKDKDEIINIVESKNGNKLLNPDDYINVKTKNLKVVCGLCGSHFTTSLGSIMNSDGLCRKCGIKKSSNSNKLTPAQVEERVNSVNNNLLLNSNDYINNSVSNLKIKCGECGKIFYTSFANYEHNGKIRCDSCSQKISEPERKVMSILNRYNIKYIYNHRFKDCKDKRMLPFDFYLPEFNMIIETDGEHHFRPIWGDEYHNTTRLHDAIKNEYCKNNNIKLLRIPFWNFNNIEDIIVKEFKINSVFNNEKKYK